MHKKVLAEGEGDSAGEFTQLEHIPIEVSEIHPQYNPKTNEYDFWFIKLQWPSQLYADQVIGLDSPTDDFELTSNDELVTMGFGKAVNENMPPNILKEVKLKYISNADCIAPKTNYPSTVIFDSMLCLKSDGLENKCRVIFSTFCLCILS